MSDPKRRNTVTPIGELVGDVIEMLPGRSDAWWEEREAELGRDRQRREADEAAAAQAKRVAAMVECGLPVRHLEQVLAGGLRETDSLAYVRQHPAGIHVLLGPKGVGKSLAAVAWLLLPREAPRYLAPGPARFVDAPALARWPRYEEQRMRELERAGALVIDDLGVEFDDRSGAFRSLLDGLVNARYAANLPTLITTNIPKAAQFREKYGDRICDRVAETGNFYGCDGDSLRRRGR